MYLIRGTLFIFNVIDGYLIENLSKTRQKTKFVQDCGRLNYQPLLREMSLQGGYSRPEWAVEIKPRIVVELHCKLNKFCQPSAYTVLALLFGVWDTPKCYLYIQIIGCNEIVHLLFYDLQLITVFRKSISLLVLLTYQMLWLSKMPTIKPVLICSQDLCLARLVVDGLIEGLCFHSVCHHKEIQKAMFWAWKSALESR